MNGMNLPLAAMLQGTANGDAQAQSILPSVYQPQAKAKPQNPWQGSLDLIVDQLLSLGNQVREQGDRHRAITVKLFKAANDIAKANEELTALLDEDNEE